MGWVQRWIPGRYARSHAKARPQAATGTSRKDGSVRHFSPSCPWVAVKGRQEVSEFSRLRQRGFDSAHQLLEPALGVQIPPPPFLERTGFPSTVV